MKTPKALTTNLLFSKNWLTAFALFLVSALGLGAQEAT